MPLRSVRELILAGMAYTGDDFRRLVIHPHTLTLASKTREFRDLVETILRAPIPETTNRLAAMLSALTTRAVEVREDVPAQFVSLLPADPDHFSMRFARLVVL